MSFTSGYRKDERNVGSEKKSADKIIPVKDRALGLLARREHSAAELKRKLQQKGYTSAVEVDNCLLRLQAEGSLSDHRFTEAYVHMRMSRGYGPMRIMAELREKGITGDLIAECLSQDASDWQIVLRHQYDKKYSGRPIEDYRDKAKRVGYLQARGFKLDWILSLLGET